MADVKWIRLSIDMFDNRKIKYLRSLPDGNNLILIWVMLLTIAGRCNAGGMIFLTENIPYTVNMLAKELDFEESTITLAINALQNLGMVDYVSEKLLITGWEEHQNADGLEKIREQNRIRKQKQRESQKAIECHVTSHDEVTHGHATELELELELEIDKDKDKDLKKNSSRFTPPTLEEVKNYCMERNNKVDADRFIDFYSSKGWMVGKNKMKDWKACIRTWEKDSKPNNVSNTAKASPNNRFNAFPQRNYTEDDYNSLEQKLLEKSKTIHK